MPDTPTTTPSRVKILPIRPGIIPIELQDSDLPAAIGHVHRQDTDDVESRHDHDQTQNQEKRPLLQLDQYVEVTEIPCPRTLRTDRDMPHAGPV